MNYNLRITKTKILILWLLSLILNAIVTLCLLDFLEIIDLVEFIDISKHFSDLQDLNNTTQECFTLHRKVYYSSKFLKDKFK